MKENPKTENRNPKRVPPRPPGGEGGRSVRISDFGFRISGRRGVALLIVLWLMAILTLLMYAFLADMQVEYAVSNGWLLQL